MADKNPDPQQEALFREVDEDLRQEQLNRLWKRYGGVVIGVAVLIVLVVAGYQGWKAWRASERQEEALAYEQALDQAQAGRVAEAAEALAALAEGGNTGHAALARLRRAALLLEQGQVEDALEAYRALAEDADADPVMRDVGRLLYALHGLDHLAPETVETALAPLTNPASAFRYSAREVQALLALKRGQEEQARDLFAGLAAEAGAPNGVRSRARDMLNMLGGAPAESGDSAADGAAG